MRLSLLSLALLLSPGPASAQTAWRDQAPAPRGAGCPMQKLEPYFWDFLENGDKPLHQHEWDQLGAAGRTAVIAEHCEDAERIHDIFVDVKVRLDYALRMARGSEQMTSSAKVSFIDRTLTETKGSAGMVEERLGLDSDLVMVLRDTRRVLEIERANLSARLSSERMQDVRANGSLQGAARIQSGGKLAVQAGEGNGLFDGSDRRSVLGEAVIAGGLPSGKSDLPAAGTMRGLSSKYDSAATKEVPQPVDPDSATGRTFKSIRNAFGNHDKEYSGDEAAYIKEQREKAWLFPGWAENDAKKSIESAYLNREYCRSNPADCRKNDAACAKDPDSGGCETARLRKRFFGK